MSIFWLFLQLFLVNKCSAVIYQLNDTEYERMPPLFGLDAYEPCLRDTNGVYCMIDLDLYGDPGNELIDLIKGYSEHHVKHYNHTYISRGVCVQKTCSNLDINSDKENITVLHELLEECLNETLANEYGVGAILRQIYYCDRHGDVMQKDAIDWVVAGIFISILAMNIIGSCYDIFFMRSGGKTYYEKGNPYLLSFSIPHNFKWLRAPLNSDQRMERLRGLHCYRTITIIIMVIAHVSWIDGVGFTENPHEFEKAYDTIHYQLMFNGMMIVQIFFVLSGFLMAFCLLVQSEKEAISLKMFPKLMFMRWWRLTPTYAVILAFTSTWLRFLGSGPLWRLRVADSVVGDCRRYWWLHLFYVNNYFPEDKFCALHTWYLGADMQLFAIGLIIFLATRSRGRILAFTTLFVLGLMIPAVQVWIQDLDGIVIMDPEFYRRKISGYFDVHTLGHNNLTCNVIGMGTACWLYHLQKRGIERKSNKMLRILCWCFIPAIAGLFLCGQGYYADGPRIQLVTRIIWASAHRLILSCIVAVAIMSLLLRFDETFCAAVEWSGWTVPGRLSYCVYLVHINFIHALMGVRTSLTQVCYYNMIIVYMGVVSMSFLAAVPLYLMVEAPFSRLLKVLTSRNHKLT